MLIKLIKFKNQNLRVETEIVLYGNLTGNAFMRMDEVNCNCLTLYLPQFLFDGKYFYVAKERALPFR